MSEKNELLPCPFCGGPAHSGSDFVECTKCGAYFGGEEKSDEAKLERLLAWNRRTPAHSPTGTIGAIDGDKLKSELESMWKEYGEANANYHQRAISAVIEKIESGQFSAHSHEGDLTPKISPRIQGEVEGAIEVLCTHKAVKDTLWMPGSGSETMVDWLINLEGELGFDTKSIEEKVLNCDFGVKQ